MHATYVLLPVSDNAYDARIIETLTFYPRSLMTLLAYSLMWGVDEYKRSMILMSQYSVVSGPYAAGIRLARSLCNMLRHES